MKLIIDTQNYMGNTHEALIAYATGCLNADFVDDINQVIAQNAQKTIKHYSWWKDNIQLQADYHYSERQVISNISEREGWCSNGMGGIFKREHFFYTLNDPALISVSLELKDLPPDDVLKEFNERIVYFCANCAEIMQDKFAATISFDGIHLSNVEISSHVEQHTEASIKRRTP